MKKGEIPETKMPEPQNLGTKNLDLSTESATSEDCVAGTHGASNLE